MISSNIIENNVLLRMELPLIPTSLKLVEVVEPINFNNGIYFGTILVNQHEWHIKYDSDLDLWWVNKRPEPLFYEILYGKLFYSSPLPEQFGYVSLETDNSRRAEKAVKNWDDIEKSIEIINKSNLLEIGCGTGEFLVESKKRGWKNSIGNELELSAAKLSEDKGFEINTGFFENIEANKYPSFDLIFADNVIEHTMNPLIFLRKSFELLQIEGLLILRLPDTQPFGPTLKLIDHTFHFSRKSISFFLIKAGFKIEKIFYSGTFKGQNYENDNNQRIENMTVIARK